MGNIVSFETANGSYVATIKEIKLNRLVYSSIFELGDLENINSQKKISIINNVLFILSFVIIHYFKPSFAYGKEGDFRQFGVGYRHKTVIPIWGVSIVLAILSYLAVLMYLRY